MDGGRHNIAGSQAFLHHIGMERIGVAAMQPVQVADTLVSGQHNAAAAAGVIGDAVVPQCIRVAPVQILRDSQMR